ncbi:MAG: NAD(P)/FAD-dependent oxidoreductase [Myxococcota bacterium]
MRANKAVVIGTGAGGLTAAATLAQSGFEVVALERAKQLGGFLNPFKRRKYHFDPGVHYVGTAWEGGMLNRVLGRFDIDATELFCEMDPDGFDVFRFPDFEMRVPKGLDRFRARMHEAFPADTREIDAFFDKLADVHALSLRKKMGLGLAQLRGAGLSARWYLQTFSQLLEGSFKNPKIRAVMAAQCGDYGLPPSRAPAVLGAALVLHFIDGSYFPRGGSGSLRDALVDKGRAMGASYRRRAEVAKIEVKNGRVRGVTLADGEFIEADVIVSAVDPTLTYGKLIDDEHLPRRLVRKVRRTVPSVASLCVFLGLERDLRDHGMGAFNVWDYPSWDIDSVFGPTCDGTLPDDYGFFLSPNSLKDDTGTMAPEGCSTLEIVTLAPFQPFAAWQNEKALKRSESYEAFKSEAADVLMASVERRWPGLVGDVAIKDVATPLTNQHFVGSPDGAIYGPSAIPAQFGHRGFRPTGPVGGLFLAGAGVFSPGVVPSLATGVVAGKAAAASVRSRSLLSLPSPLRKPLRRLMPSTAR